jgi:hypothetical protein
MPATPDCSLISGSAVNAEEVQIDTPGFIAILILAKQGETDPITILGLFWTVF